VGLNFPLAPSEYREIIKGVHHRRIKNCPLIMKYSSYNRDLQHLWDKDPLCLDSSHTWQQKWVQKELFAWSCAEGWACSTAPGGNQENALKPRLYLVTSTA